MNLILEKTDQVPYFTNIRAVLDAAGIAAQDYDWYVSDIDTNWNPPGFGREDRWFDGDELAILLRDHDLQFNWAVFSAVPKGCRPPVPSAPYADGNSDYWTGVTVRPQLSGALFEIACWDSSAVILVGLPEQAAAAFVAAYPDTRPLPAPEHAA